MSKILDKTSFFCSGCGLCFSKTGYINTKGFNFPKFNNNLSLFYQQVCPCYDHECSMDKDSGIWGKYQSVYLGYSTNNAIRYKASSGGIITSVCTYLLEKNVVDGIIHVTSDSKKPWRNITVVSTNRNDLLKRSGSRYSQSSPLIDLQNLIDINKRYAFVGKPCDVYALKQYLKIDKKLKKNLILTISFFCAGIPSENANIKLVETLIQNDPADCINLDYRGNGWPGKTIVRNSGGNEYTMDYEESWGKILGRDINRFCRFCMNGLGEPADISCGDAWILDNNNEPSFSERDGVNVVFARTQRGLEILNKSFNDGYIFLDDYSDKINQLKFIQASQHDRKATMLSKILALWLCNKPIPSYDLKLLYKLSKSASFLRLFEVFKGTVGRIVRKDI